MPIETELKRKERRHSEKTALKAMIKELRRQGKAGYELASLWLDLGIEIFKRDGEKEEIAMAKMIAFLKLMIFVKRGLIRIRKENDTKACEKKKSRPLKAQTATRMANRQKTEGEN